MSTTFRGLSRTLILSKRRLTHACAQRRAATQVTNFNENYFFYHGRYLDSRLCPNVLYVAATRASERLYVLAEEAPGGHLPFLRREVRFR